MKLLTNSSFLLLAGLLAAPALAENPYAQADGTWINISGTVQTVERDAFTLDYGDGIVTVEMDDGDRDADAYKLLSGDEVTVSGMIDDDFFETTSIEASSVYVDSIDTYFFASSIDEEGAPFLAITTPVQNTSTIVQGKVTEVGDDHFTLDTGTRKLTVDVDELGYDPLDDDGYQKIEVNDRVSVSGEMESDLFDDRELEADLVVTLSP